MHLKRNVLEKFSREIFIILNFELTFNLPEFILPKFNGLFVINFVDKSGYGVAFLP